MPGRPALTECCPFRTIGQALAITAVAMLIGAGHSWLVPIKLQRSEAPAQAGPTEVETDGQPGAPEGDVARDALGLPAPEDGLLTLEWSLEHYNAGSQFFDARRSDEFNEARIDGAWWMPSERLTSGDGVELVTTYLDPTAPVVIYCTGGDCDASHNAALMLEELGFTSILIMTASFDDWTAGGEDAGYYVATGPDESEFGPP